MADQKRILIIGGSGFVGTNLARDLSSKYSVICTYRNQVTRLPGVDYVRFLNLTEKDHCKALLQRIEPAAVIYATGSNDILYAESNSRLTQHLHTAGATHIQASSEGVKARFIYLSADTLFSGHGGNYAEGDTAIPPSAIGKAKLGAENHIRGRSLNYLIIRASPLLGRGPLDHPSWVDRLRESVVLKKKLKLSKRLLRNPIHVRYLSEMILKALEQDLRNQTLHLGGLTKITEYDLGTRVLKALNLPIETLEVVDEAFTGEPIDYSLNFSQTLAVCPRKPVLLEDSLKDLIRPY